jgi:hypothetical protein
MTVPASGKVTLSELQAYSNPPGEGPLTQRDASASQYSKTREQLIQQAVVSPPQPSAYRALQVGPEMALEYEATLVPQVEHSKSLLRTLSPFMIQLEPPRVFGESGGFLSQSRKKNQIDPGLYSASAQSSGNGYEASRKALAQSGIVGLDYTATSMQEVVVPNGAGPQTGLTAEETRASANGTASGKLGQPAIADIYTAVDIAWQLSVLMNVPPLVLLINPTTMTVSRTKVQQFSDRSRNGYIYQAWGEDQVALSITARCGAFISGSRGVSYASKRDSVAWQNLMNAFHFYKSNGYIYDTVGKSNAHHFVGALSIRYDQWVYYGHMASLNFTYDESNILGGVEFTMEFIASQVVDTAQTTYTVLPMKSPMPSPSDPRYSGMENQSYGQPEFVVGWDGVEVQGRPVGAGDAFQALVPLNAVMPWDPDYKKPAPNLSQVGGSVTGDQGFQTLPTRGERSVVQARTQYVRPFGGL